MPVATQLSIKEREALNALIFYGFWFRIYQTLGNSRQDSKQEDSDLLSLHKLIFNVEKQND